MTFSPMYQILMKDRIERRLIGEMPKVKEKYQDYESPSIQDIYIEGVDNLTDFRKMNEFWKIQMLNFNHLNEE